MQTFGNLYFCKTSETSAGQSHDSNVEAAKAIQTTGSICICDIDHENSSISADVADV